MLTSTRLVLVMAAALAVGALLSAQQGTPDSRRSPDTLKDTAPETFTANFDYIKSATIGK